MSKILQLTGLPSYTHPLTYGVGLQQGHRIKLRDADADTLSAVTINGTPAFTLSSGNAFDFDVSMRFLTPVQPPLTWDPVNNKVLADGQEIGALATPVAQAVAAQSWPLTPNVAQDIIVTANGPSYVEIVVPDTGFGTAHVISQTGFPVTVGALQRAGGIRMGASASTAYVLPSLSTVLDVSAGKAFTLGLLLRINDINQLGTTLSHPFLKIGSYFEFGYEGPNATNPGCMKLLMPNAAASGPVSLRSNASPTPAFAAFAAANIGKHVFALVRKTGASPVTETMLSPTTGLPVSVTLPAESLTLCWGFLQDSDPASIMVYGGSVNIAASTTSTPTGTASLTVGRADAGTHDVFKFFALSQFVAAADVNKLLTGKRPQDAGLTVVSGTDRYFDIDSTSAALMIDQIDGVTTMTSATLGGADAATPAANMPRTRKFMGSSSTRVTAAFDSGRARGF